LKHLPNAPCFSWATTHRCSVVPCLCYLYTLFKYWWICSRPPYAWNICRWLLSNKQSINQSDKPVIPKCRQTNDRSGWTSRSWHGTDSVRLKRPNKTCLTAKSQKNMLGYIYIILSSLYVEWVYIHRTNTIQYINIVPQSNLVQRYTTRIYLFICSENNFLFWLLFPAMWYWVSIKYQVTS